MLDADGYPPAFLEIGDLRLEFGRSRLGPAEVTADVRITLSAKGRS
jgi:methionyl-tRNA formyltransferase